MYWELSGTNIITPTVPFHKIGVNQDVTLTLVTESGEDFENCYLCVIDQSHVGLMQGKLSTGASYRTLRGLFNANCFLGDISASSSTDINFRINFPEGSSQGLTNIIVILGHDDGAEIPGLLFSDLGELWFDLEDLELWVDLEDLEE